MKRTLIEQRLRRRSLVLLALMIGWMLAIGGRMAYLQVVQHDALLELAQRQHQGTLRISALRGVIYDRQGRELARSVEVPSLYAVPGEIVLSQDTTTKLAQVLKLDPDDLSKKFSQERGFVWIKRKVTYDEADAVAALQLAGIHFINEYKRYYPNNQLAGHILGYAGIDEVGLDGIELAYDSHLRGQDGYVMVQRDALGRSYRQAQSAGNRGQDLALTIDAVIQLEAEKALREAVTQTRARSGVAIVMRPKTGEILALTSVPSFDPNKFSTTPEDIRRNRAIHDIYEPGSVFKIVTYAATLEEQRATPEENIDCLGGQIALAGHTIRDHKPFGVLSVREALENSSNIGAIRLALRLGPGKLASYVERFGFGQLTRIDLPGEVRGLHRPVSRWSNVSIGSIAMGQEIGVTAIQMLTAMTVIANKGVWVQPHVLRALYSHSGDVLLETRPQTRRVISPETTHTLSQMLEGVILRGTGKRASLKGYTAAGKTGTAQQFDPQTGRYSQSRYVASFCGFAPATDPQVSILVMLDGPRGRYYGGEVAAPVFRQVAETALQSLKVPPDLVGGSIQLAALEQELISEWTSGLVPAGATSDPVDPQKNQTAPQQDRVAELETQERRETDAQNAEDRTSHEQRTASNRLVIPPTPMPDFRGLGIRSVAQECARLGLRLIISGSGQAARQAPKPGTPIEHGLTCTVHFER